MESKVSEFISEDQFQASCVKWFDEEYYDYRQMLFSVPNGGLRDKRTAALMQATGTRAGASDLVLVLYKAVIFIELKLPNGVQSREQEMFQKAVEARGHLYFLLRTKEQFMNLINKLIVR